MAWTKKSTGGGNKFLKWAAGEAYEGVFKGAIEKPSPFNPGTMIWDYRLLLKGETEEQVLSSSSETLKAILPITPVNTKVRIEMIAKGGRKMYDVYIDE